MHIYFYWGKQLPNALEYSAILGILRYNWETVVHMLPSVERIYHS